jgi:hypothetical protein
LNQARHSQAIRLEILNPFSAKEQNKPILVMQMFSVTFDKLVLCQSQQHSVSSLTGKPFCPLFAFLISSR